MRRFQDINSSSGHLRPASKPHASDISDSPRNMDLPGAPCSETLHITLVSYRSVAWPYKRHDHLPAVRMAAQHQLPRISLD